MTRRRDAHNSRRDPNSRLRSEFLFWAPVLVAVTAACLFSTWTVIGGPNSYLPVGIDLMGHLTKGYLFAERWRSGRFSDWCYEWYVGATLSQYYPPLSNWVCGVLQFFLGNLFITFKIFATACLVGSGLAVAGLTRRLGGNTTASAVAGILYPTANYTLFSVFIDGTLGRTLGLPFFPLLLHALIDLAENQTAKNWVRSSLYVFILCLAHAMHAYHLFLMIAVFMLVWCVRYRDKWRRILLMAEASLTGVLLTSFWVVPGLTQLELKGVPYSRPEMVGERTAGLVNLLSPRSSQGSTVMYALSLLGCLVLWLGYRRRLDSAAFLSSLLLTGSLIYGPGNPIYRLLPLTRNLAPVRFINATILPAAVCAGLLGGFFAEVIGRLASRARTELRISSGIVVTLFVFVLATHGNAPVGLREPSYYGWLRTLVERVPSGGVSAFESGRVAQEMPNIGGEAVFFPVEAGFNLTVGWNIEGTPHVYTLQDHNTAYKNGRPEYVLRNWYLWNARSALIDERSHAAMGSLLLEEGWKRVDSERGIGLFTLSEPPSYFMNLHSDVLVIGRSSFCVASLFPWVTQGREPNPLHYDEEYTDLFKCIVLYDLPPVNKERLEARIIRWVNQGKQVIVDLSFTDSISDILDVHARQVVLEGNVQMIPTAEGVSLFGETVDMNLNPGRGAVYSGLDRTYLTLSTDRGEAAVFGVRELQTGDVWFIGGHVPRLAAPDCAEEARRVWGAILRLADPRTGFRPSPFPIQDAVWDSKGVSFRYDATDETPMVLSVTYTPRWKAKVDGVDWPVLSHENLMLLVLPSGSHKVTVEYGTTWVAAVGWAVSACALLWMGLRALLPAPIQRKAVSSGLSWTGLSKLLSAQGR